MNGCELELADTLATPVEIAAELAQVTGLSVTYEYGDCQAMLDMGFRPGVINAQEWQAEVGYPALPEMATRKGISTLSFREWAMLHKDEFHVS